MPPKEQWNSASTSSTSSRYECPVCRHHFCIDCDLFAHEVVHNCPGCQSIRMQTSLMGETETQVNNIDGDNTQSHNGVDVANGDMMHLD
jgi:transcription initiation factor TFIIH subunit 2